MKDNMYTNCKSITNRWRAQGIISRRLWLGKAKPKKRYILEKDRGDTRNALSNFAECYLASPGTSPAQKEESTHKSTLDSFASVGKRNRKQDIVGPHSETRKTSVQDSAGIIQWRFQWTLTSAWPVLIPRKAHVNDTLKSEVDFGRIQAVSPQ